MSARTVTLVLTVGITLLGALNCVSVRVVNQRPGEGGIVALPANYRGEVSPRYRRDEAEALMQENCAPNDYRIVDEVEVGARMVPNQQRHMTVRGAELGMGPGMSRGQGYGHGATTSFTVPGAEWHIYYRCMAPAEPAPDRAP